MVSNLEAPLILACLFLNMTQLPRLSNREWDVLKLLLQGKSNKLIASFLGISVRTVEFHLKNIYAKFQVSSRIELILKLGKTTGGLKIEKPGCSTVDKREEVAENRDRLNARMGWATSFKETVSIIGKELAMKTLLNFKHVLVGVFTALSAGGLWVATMLYSQTMRVYEIKEWAVPLIVTWALIGLLIGLVGKRNGIVLRKTFLGALLGTGLSPITIIPLMVIVVVPFGKLLEWLGWIDPATIPGNLATVLTAITMMTIWLVVGLTIGMTLLFVTIKKPEPSMAQPSAPENGF